MVVKVDQDTLEAIPWRSKHVNYFNKSQLWSETGKMQRLLLFFSFLKSFHPVLLPSIRSPSPHVAVTWSLLILPADGWVQWGPWAVLAVPLISVHRQQKKGGHSASIYSSHTNTPGHVYTCYTLCTAGLWSLSTSMHTSVQPALSDAITGHWLHKRLLCVCACTASAGQKPQTSVNGEQSSSSLPAVFFCNYRTTQCS